MYKLFFLKTHDSVALPLYNSLPTNRKLPSLDLSSGTETKSVSKKSKKRKQAPKSTSQKDTQEQSQVNQSEGEKQKKIKDFVNSFTGNKLFKFFFSFGFIYTE